MKRKQLWLSGLRVHEILETPTLKHTTLDLHNLDNRYHAWITKIGISGVGKIDTGTMYVTVVTLSWQLS